MTAPLLAVRGLSKAYGSGEHLTQAVGRIDFEVVDGEFLSVVGPSGCGKTTLLRCLSGLLRPSTGETLLQGRRIEAPPDGMAVVFQDYSRSLLPWKTVRKNVALPLVGHTERAERDARVTQALEAVNLHRFTDHYPWQLSGGMQQRVAIARALAYQPRILLMDEPFASVDAQTRAELEDLVLDVHHRFGITVLQVTHDIDEATYMADRVVVLSAPPSTVKEIIEIPLPRPRDQLETKRSPLFVDLRSRVFSSIVGGPR